MSKTIATGVVKFTLLARKWAVEIGLGLGNLWEPIIVRQMTAEWEYLGRDEHAETLVIATFANRLGVSVE